MQKKWTLAPIPNPEKIQHISEQLALDECLSTLLVQRGIDSYERAKDYFSPSLENAHSPFLMKNMKTAVERLNQAIKNNEKIAIYGDYDVDGTTSVSLFVNVIRPYYSNFTYYIPDRFSEGYGLNVNAVQTLKDEGCSLLFTLDCGIRSVEEIQFAKRLGMDVIVCDHHEPGEIVPDGYILNPKQKDCSYPFKDLCGCGVTFKFLQAVFSTNDWNIALLQQNTDLLTLAISADIVSIVDENRIFCFVGLQQINSGQDTVIDLFFKVAGKFRPFSLTDIVFAIAPRINAAGRMDHARKIVELFTETDLNLIQEKIREIDTLNTNRRSIDQRVTQEALAKVEQQTTRFSNVVFDRNWAKGVLGIVASKLVENSHRPTIVLTESNGVLSGSGRSIPQVNLFEVLTECKEEMEQFGGHAFACGLTLKEENLSNFQLRLDEAIEKRSQTTDFTPEQKIDLEIYFKNIYRESDLLQPKRLPKFVRILERMEPFGPGNMHPVFLSKNVFISEYRILKEAHVKLSFQQSGFPYRLEGIAFNFADEFKQIETGKPVEIIYTIGINTWNNSRTVQLDIRGMRNESA